MVKTMVAVAMMEVNLVLLSLERGNIGEGEGREVVGVEMDSRNVLARTDFMPIKCMVTGPKSLRDFWNVGNGLGGQVKTRKI